MVKITGDAGHGYNTSGKRTPDGEREWSFNDKVIRAFEEEIKQYEGVEFRRLDDPTGKTDVPLKTRTDQANAWGSRVHVSFHHNANTSVWGTWGGVETHVYKTRPADSTKLAQLVQPELVKAYGLRDRGIKFTDLHITRETNMTSILVEGGFMDSTTDIGKLRDNNVLRNAGIGIAKAVASYLGLKRKSTPVAPPQPDYRVGTVTGDVWLHSTPDFNESSRVRVLKKGEAYKVWGEVNGMYAIGGYVSKNYMTLN